MACGALCHRTAEGAAAREWAEWEAEGTRGKNNSELVDAGGANQGLSSADIDAMKAAGVGGQAILDALAANSATFEGKTQFAQVPASSVPCFAGVALAGCRSCDHHHACVQSMP